MAQEESGLGEQALNKIAEMALASQLEEAERLDVQVKTDPGKLAEGKVESITIQGEGLVLQPDISVAELEIEINQVAVKPLKALFGKIVLTRPSDGSARIVITEENLDQALNSESFHTDLRQQQIMVAGKPVTIDVQQVNSRLLSDGKLAIRTQLTLSEPEAQTVAFTATLGVGSQGQGVVLQEVTQTQGEELPPEALSALVTQVSDVLSLRDLDLEGMTLQIQHLEVTEGNLLLHAAVRIEQFPS